MLYSASRIITNLARYIIDGVNPETLPPATSALPIHTFQEGQEDFYSQYHAPIIEEVLASLRDALEKTDKKARRAGEYYDCIVTYGKKT